MGAAAGKAGNTHGRGDGARPAGPSGLIGTRTPSGEGSARIALDSFAARALAVC